MAGLGSSFSKEVDSQSTEDNCPLQCFNKGKCNYHDLTNEFYCDCPLTESGGYLGIHCETPFLECTDGKRRAWRCLNGGMCLSGETTETCHCPDEFIGARCQVFAGPVDSVLLPVDDAEFPGGVSLKIVTASVIFGFGCFLIGYIFGRGSGLVHLERNVEGRFEAAISHPQPENVDSQPTNENLDPTIVSLQQDNEPPEVPKGSEIT